MTLSKSLTFSEPQIPLLPKEAMEASGAGLVWEVNVKEVNGPGMESGTQ